MSNIDYFEMIEQDLNGLPRGGSDKAPYSGNALRLLHLAQIAFSGYMEEWRANEKEDYEIEDYSRW